MPLTAEEKLAIAAKMESDPVFQKTGKSIEAGVAYVEDYMNKYVDPYSSPVQLKQETDPVIDRHMWMFRGKSPSEVLETIEQMRTIRVPSETEGGEKQTVLTPERMDALHTALEGKYGGALDVYNIEGGRKFGYTFNADRLEMLSNGQLALVNNNSGVMQQVSPEAAIGYKFLPDKYRSFAKIVPEAGDKLFKETFDRHMSK